MTRTYTRFFVEDNLVGIRRELSLLEESWEKRKRFIEPRVRVMGDRRLLAVRSSIDLLEERVAE